MDGFVLPASPLASAVLAFAHGCQRSTEHGARSTIGVAGPNPGAEASGLATLERPGSSPGRSLGMLFPEWPGLQLVISGVAVMPRTALQNLINAERVCDYVGRKMTKGASNKNIDLMHAEMRRIERSKNSKFETLSRWFSKPDLTSKSVDEQRAKIDTSLPLVELVFANARTVEASGIGNCGEQASVAFKYICENKLSERFCLAKLGCNHEFIILGANGQDTNGTHYVGKAPAWPAAAVVCDPWFNEWFIVQSDWSRKIRSILRETEPGWTQVQTDIRSVIDGPLA